MAEGSLRWETRRVVLDGTIQQVVARPDGYLATADGRLVPEEAVAHLPPCEPSKVIAVHFNFASRHSEMGRPKEFAPTFFAKLPSSLVGHRGSVIRPKGCQYLNYEGEIALVVGLTARNVRPEEAGRHIAGYTIANDFGIHDFRDTDWGSMLRVKSSDSMCPLGPGLVTGWISEGKRLRTWVNGELRQDGSTDEMLWSPEYLLCDLSRTITLLPGDVILCGTPANSRPTEPGDVVAVEVEGIGRLENTVEEAALPLAPDIGAQPTKSENVLSVALGGDYAGRP